MSEPQAVVRMLDQMEDETPLAVVQDKSSQIFAAILRTDATPEERKELYAFYRQIRADEAKDAFNLAMKSAQDEMGPVARKTENKHLGSKYATLEAIDLECRPIYAKHGFSLTFNSKFNDDKGELTVSCKCLHTAGHVEEYELSGGLDGAGAQGKSNKTPIQAVGSTITYLKRYLTCMIFNIQLINEDLDGNAQKPKPAMISQEQADTLNTMLNDAGYRSKESRDKWYAWAGCESLSTMPVDVYEKAVKMLEGKLKK